MIRKFTAPNTTQGLHIVRQSMGADALILSTKETTEGLELLAVRACDLELLGQPQPQPQPLVDTHSLAPMQTAQSAAPGPGLRPEHEPHHALISELQSLRDLVHERLRPATTVAPGVQRSQQRLAQSGLSASTVEAVLEGLDSESLEGPDWLQVLVTRLSAMLPVQQAMPLLQKGGTFVVMGPTGVGKTTALAKMAARCVLQHGQDQVALVSCDNFRIGAQEQLRIYAGLLGIPMVGMGPSDQLDSSWTTLLSKRVVLIDTAGVSPQEIQLLQKTEAIYRSAPGLHRLLVISATTDSPSLMRIFEMYHRALGLNPKMDFSGCILTKLDEAASLGPALDSLIRHQLPLWFTSDGQRVPEDLSEPRAEFLTYKLLHRLARQTPAMPAQARQE